MGRVKGRPWTPKEDEVLRRLAAAGMNAQTLAGEMGRSDTKIRKRAKEIEVMLSKAQLGPGDAAKGKHYS
jgi:hypothetical protein